MFKNFITLAYRHFVRSPVTSFIQVFGLTAALTASLLILLWVDLELSYDKFIENYNRIYRLEMSAGAIQDRIWHSYYIGEEISNKIPEVQRVIRLEHHKEERLQVIDQNLEDVFNIELIYADPEFVKTFSIDFIQGSPSNSLTGKNKIVLTESLATAIFPNGDIVGRTLKDERGRLVEVSGVIRDLSNFHINFQAIRSLLTLEDDYSFTEPKDWLFITYFLIESNSNIQLVNQKITALRRATYPEHIREKFPDPVTHLRPLSDIYFNRDIMDLGYSKHGNISKITAIISIAVFSLLLACLNFINLSSVKSLERIKEIAIKKVSGASRISLFLQFFGEVVLINVMALGLSLVFCHALIPRLNLLMDSSISMTQFMHIKFVSFVAFGVLLMSLAASGGIGLMISSIEPSRAIKGNVGGGFGRSKFRKMALVMQFFITIFLFIGIHTILRQIDYMKMGDLGFNQEYLVYFDFNDYQHTEESKALINTLKSSANVLEVTQTFNGVPGNNTQESNSLTTVIFNENEYQIRGAGVDPYYLDLMDVQLVEGRFFDPARKNDRQPWGVQGQQRNVMINESAKELLGFKDPIGKVVNRAQWDWDMTIIGVVADYRLNAMHSEIAPMYFWWGDNADQMLIKISQFDIPSTLRFIESEVEKVTSMKPDIQFVDETIEEQYGDVENFAELIGYLTTLIIIIGSVGLLGTFLQSIKIRIKEIGIRKVLGASLSQIVKLLANPIFKAIIIASFIAIPIGTIVMNNWLANYPYRIVLDWTIFAVAIGSTLLIAGLTIGWQCWQASKQNPARLIRYE